MFAFSLLLALPSIVSALRYPNEIVETPTVVCETDRIIVKVRTTSSNPSLIYAEEFHENPECIVRHMNKIQIFHNSCGMTAEKMKNPSGTTYRLCLAVQIHPLFVTESDRSYCAQCVYMDSNVVEDLQQTIAVSESAPNELDPQFDEFSTPRCSYSIRRGTVDGTPIHYATIGETVFHVWQCDNGTTFGSLCEN